MRFLALLFMSLFSWQTFADTSHTSSCRIIKWSNDVVVKVNSAMHHGTRIQFPSDLKRQPVSSNEDMWQAEGEMNQVLLKPTSKTKHGNSAVVRVFTKSGYAYDIHATRTNHTKQDICVKVVHDVDQFGTIGDELSAMAFVGPQTQKALMFQNQQHRQETNERDRFHGDMAKKAVVEALRRYRYHIYTRYILPENETLVSDVYDDGRFTHIRLTRSNGGLLSIESKIGGKTEMVEADYDDAYSMYTIVGIYPEFTMRLNGKSIHITRRDFRSKGEF